MRTSDHLCRALCLCCAAFAFVGPADAAPKSAKVMRVLLLNWYDRNYPANARFESLFQAALRSQFKGYVDYYSEYLETNRFPEEQQAVLLSDYLRQKYAGRPIDVLVTSTSPALDFVLKHRPQLFPHLPIVFATERPVPRQTQTKYDATGIVYLNSYAGTVGLALQLHPDAQRLFVVSGTQTHDRAFETIARDALKPFENRLSIVYLTDLPPRDLAATLRSLPARSIVLYVWQQFRSEVGELFESQRILLSVAPSAVAPVYAMSNANVGLGIVGGYVWTLEANASRLAAIVVRVAGGVRPSDIPVENAPATPMFDWRQLQRWQIREGLPAGSVIRFSELTLWQRQKWRILAAILVFGLQASLIAALLIGRRRTRRSQMELQDYKDHLELLVRERTAELVEAGNQAMAANRAKSAFLANMSHELRTPLNAILGFCAILLRDNSLSEQHRNDLSVVGTSGEHLLTLIDDVLDMAKIESGGIVVENAPLDLHALVRETVTMMRGRALAKNLHLLLEISPRTPVTVVSDAGKLRQILTNLIGNGVKYTDHGRVIVRLDVKGRDNPCELLLRFEVQDTGIGIAPEEQTHVFDPFYQAASLRERQGTGLGLSITRHFVQALNGSIRVESALGKGSRFQVEIPAKAAAGLPPVLEAAGPARVIGLEPGQPELRILIVEDQKENWLLLRRLLEKAGLAVQVAEDGLQAIEAFESWRPHFIWMDLRLPVVSGIDAAKCIRKLEGGITVKIAAVTASVFASQREEVMAAGFDDFLRKPYRPTEIFECMARHLNLRYLYQSRPEPPTVDPSVLRPEDLAALPASLRDELSHALLALDRDRISGAVQRIAEQNPSLGRLLARFSEKLTYTPIFDALEKSKTPAESAHQGQREHLRAQDSQ